MIVYKNFGKGQSLKQHQFNPFRPDNIPENCGFGLRMLSMNSDLNRLDFKSANKNIDISISIHDFVRIDIHPLTLEIIKIQGKLKKKENEPVNLSKILGT